MPRVKTSRPLFTQRQAAAIDLRASRGAGGADHGETVSVGVGVGVGAAGVCVAVEESPAGSVVVAPLRADEESDSSSDA